MGDYTKYINQIRRLLNDDRPIRAGIEAALKAQKQRIFTSGMDSAGGKIGVYSRKPATIKGTRYPRGYAEYKSALGKNPGFVILRDTDSLMDSYNFEVVQKNNEYTVAPDAANFNKTKWMESKYKKTIFAHTAAEKRLLFDVINKQISAFISV